MGRRVLNRKEMRNDFDAAERRKEDDEREDDEEEEEDDDEEEEGEEGEEDAEESDEDESDEDSGDEDDEDAPKKKKKKKVAKVKAPAAAKPKSRARAPKIVRMRVIWGVFNNSHQMVKSFDYPRKADAEALAAQLMADKKSTHFVQPVKEAIEEKKDDEKKK